MLRRSGAVRDYVTIVDAVDAYLLRSEYWYVLLVKTEQKGRKYEYPYIGRQSRFGNLAVTELLHVRIAGGKASHINGNTLDNRRCNLRLHRRASAHQQQEAA